MRTNGLSPRQLSQTIGNSALSQPSPALASLRSCSSLRPLVCALYGLRVSLSDFFDPIEKMVRAHAKKILKMAKGFYGRAKSCYTVGVERVEKGMQYAFRDRKVRKREMRSSWIETLNTGARGHGLTYSQLANGLVKTGFALDRKVLSELAMSEPFTFSSICSVTKPLAVTRASQGAGVAVSDSKKQKRSGLAAAL